MNRFWLGLFIFWPILAVVSCWISPAMGWWFPSEPATPLGVRIDDLFYFILVVVAVTFVGTQAALVYAMWRAAGNRDGKASFTYGAHNLEMLWTIVPAGILLFLSLYQLDVWAQYRVRGVFEDREGEGSIARWTVAEVTARQFEWRIRYPAPGRPFKNETEVRRWIQNRHEPGDLYDVNDLHVPINQPVVIHLRSGDVQHSFFVPDLRVKQDALPGQIIPVWFEVQPTEPVSQTPFGRGWTYDLTCAELCGWGHYKMRGQVLAQPDKDFAAYLRRLEADQNEDGVPKPSDSSGK